MQTDDDLWQLMAVDDLELVRWFEVPLSEPQDVDEQWIAQIADRLVPALSPIQDGDVDTDVRAELRYALEEASRSQALALFQLWPVDRPVSLLCGVELHQGALRPEEGEGWRVVAHEVDAQYLGPGMQYSVERPQAPGMDSPLITTQFVFDDGTHSLVLGLSEAPAPLIARALPGLVLLKDSLGLQRPDGSTFQGSESGNAGASEFWQIGGGR